MNSMHGATLHVISGRKCQPITVHEKMNIQVLQEPISNRFRLPCPRVFFPAEAILENESILGTRFPCVCTLVDHGQRPISARVIFTTFFVSGHVI